MRLLILVLMLLVTAPTLGGANQVPLKAVKVSEKYLGMRERTGHNDHPQINQWARLVGLDNVAQIRRTGEGYSWCLLTVYGVFSEAAIDLNKRCPLPKLARVSSLYEYAKADEVRYQVIPKDQLIAGAVLGQPGDILIMLFGNGSNPNGHAGILRAKQVRLNIPSREGNTNKAGSREGDGVYDKNRSATSIKALIRVK